MDWQDFLSALKAVGGSTDMQTNKTWRYPWQHHFCRNERLVDIVIYARPAASHLFDTGVLISPPRDWSTLDLLLADYTALALHGGHFNDTAEALKVD
jgi:hypothetical protein